MGDWTLPTDCPVPWTEGQEKAMKRDYPFHLPAESTLQESLIQVYLEYLWLPESLMPLRFFAPVIQRLLTSSSLDSTSKSSSTSPDMVGVLDPMLLTVRTCASKYARDIPEILAQEDTPEEELEAEESLIWYAFHNEKAPEQTSASTSTFPSTEAEHNDDETWRKRWLGRMEKRETQIQILLYLLKLAQPTPPKVCMLSPLRSSPSKSSPSKRKRGPAPPDGPAPALEDRLESLMDRLAMWQILGSIEDTQGGPVSSTVNPLHGPKDERDWMQRFCEDIVEPAFSVTLPEPCQILRSKVFPQALFSDDSDTEGLGKGSRSTSPEPMSAVSTTSRDGLSVRGRTSVPARKKRALSRASSRFSSLAPDDSGTLDDFGDGDDRNKLSASLAEDRNLRRSASIGASAAASRRLLLREVSLSRSFKSLDTKAKASSSRSVTPGSAISAIGGGSLAPSRAPSRTASVNIALPSSQASQMPNPQRQGTRDGNMLVENTPAKAVKTRTDLPRARGPDAMVGLLVESTPTKAKTR